MAEMGPDTVTIRPARVAAGRVRVPGDKSISHRYALLAALAEGESTIDGYSTGADCAATLACLTALGVRIRQAAPGRLLVEGKGFTGLRQPSGTLDAANSGTTMRLMAGVLSSLPFRTVIDGDASLARRPMRRVMEPLVAMGAQIAARDGRPPLTIDGARLHGIAHRPEVPSAQVKSAVLLAGLQADGETSVIEPARTRDHTERALKAFGVSLRSDEARVTIDGGQRLQARNLTVPGDISSATFWMVLAASRPGSEITIDGVGLNPTRTAVIEILRRAGASVSAVPDGERDGEPVGSIRAAYGKLRGFSIEPHEVPSVIDEIPALAALAALLPEGEQMHVEGAAELRVKESDRIACLATGMRAFGAQVEEYPDGFELTAQPPRSATVDACGDHRLAMAFALVASGCAAPSTIAGASSVAVSYPGFFEQLGRLASSGDGR
jgi:3-phosphoshikimate 1-carboxyvinyltransferase